jgi:hypothetical protein
MMMMLVCPLRTSEPGGEPEGDCHGVKEGGKKFCSTYLHTKLFWQRCPLRGDFGRWSQVLHGNVGIRKALPVKVLSDF